MSTTASVNIYDPDTEICCNGTVHTWKAGWRCCGTQSYNPKNHICCFGKLMTLPGNGIYGCCGEPQQPTLFQYGQHDCCHGQVVELSHLNTYYGCCRTKVYYPEKELCCNGHVKPQVGNLTCCGEEMIDENEQLCCQKLTKVNGKSLFESVPSPPR